MSDGAKLTVCALIYCGILAAILVALFVHGG